MSERTHSIELSALRVTAILAIAVGAVAALGLVGQVVKYQAGHTNVFGIVPEFYLDDENHVPTYLASLLLLIAAGLLAVIASVKHRIGDGFKWHWTVLSALFLLMSLDETAGNLTYTLIASAEEALEMAAVVLFIHALLAYVSRQVDSVRFRIGAG